MIPRDSFSPRAMSWREMTALAGLSALLSGRIALAMPGDLDPTFGEAGRVRTNVTEPSSANGSAMALQQDGKIVVAGGASNGNDVDFAIVRYNTDGTLDLGFGLNGKAFASFGSHDTGNAVAVQADGKIVVAGSSWDGVDFPVAVVRYHSDGTLDTSFGEAGKVAIGLGGYSIPRALAVQGDGGIVVTGEFYDGSDRPIAIVRLTPDGDLDPTFDSDGIVLTTVGAADATATSIALQADGKIVIAGDYDYPATALLVARYHANGSLDSSFDSDGVAFVTVGSGWGSDRSVGIQADGKIVATTSALVNSQVVLAAVRLLADGSPDNSFDGDGQAIVPLDATGPIVGTIQADGKILAACTVGGDISIVRFLSDGSLDTTFDGDGKLLSDFGSASASVAAVAATPDGQILAAGSYNSQFLAARYNGDGTRDTGFDSDGFATTSVGLSRDFANDVLVQGNGRIVVIGHSDAPQGGQRVFAVTRYLPSGAPDTSFGLDGKVTTQVGETVDAAYAGALQPDGRLVVVGNAAGGFAVVRYDDTGALDPTFSDDGKTTTTVGSGGVAHAVALQPDGKIVVGGTARVGTYNDFALARYNPDGTLDTSFDIDGKLTTAIGAGNDSGKSVAIQPDGKIVLAGWAFDGSFYSFAAARYLADGTLDPSFSGDGKTSTVMQAFSDEPVAVAIQADGKIVLAGHIYNGANFNDIALVRYNADGTLDASFDGDGKVTTNFDGEMGRDLVIRGDGSIYVAGHRTDESGTDFVVLRYLTDGTLDATFHVDGSSFADFGGRADDATAIALQGDGKIVLAGTVTGIDGQDFAVARFLEGDCGDGVLQGGESCDPGSGEPGDCCSATCTYETAGTSCGSTADTVCTDPDTCDASGVCQQNHSASTTVCRSATGDCDIAENCTGVSGACPADVFAPVGTACGNSAGTICDHPDTCSANGFCAPNLEPVTTVCRSAAGACDVAEHCSGTGSTCPVNAFATAGTACGSSSDTACDNPDSCDGTGSCALNLEPAATVCRAAAGSCDVAETCTGVDPACPVDSFADAGTACGSTSDTACDDPDTCDGAGSCATNLETAGTICRPASGACDVAESCDGVGASCPADLFTDAGSACPADTNECTDDACDGAGACLHADNSAPCDDGLYCTGNDTCADGACGGGLPLACDDGDLCSIDSCDASIGCVHVFEPLPEASCLVAGRGQLFLKRNGPARKFRWSWKEGEALDDSQLGRPDIDTPYSLCIYDSTSGVHSLAFSLGLPPGVHWQPVVEAGVEYRDRTGSSDGVQSLNLRTGPAGRSRAKLKAAGDALELSSPFSLERHFAQEPVVDVQLINADGLCIWSRFDAESTRSNQPFRFKASNR